MLVSLLLTQIIIHSLSYAQEENDVRLYLPPPDVSTLTRTQTAIQNLFSRSHSFQLGVLQIYRNGEWGSVCDDSWDSSDMQVVCSQLNLSYSFSYSALPYFRELEQESPTYSPIWLDEVRCTGDETSLVECPSLPFGVNDCTHSEDVNLMCSSINITALYRGILAAVIILIVVSCTCYICCVCCCCPCCPLAQHIRPRARATKKTREDQVLLQTTRPQLEKKESHILEFLPTPSQEEDIHKHDAWVVENLNH